MELPTPTPAVVPTPVPTPAPAVAPVAAVPTPQASVANPFKESNLFIFLVGASLILAVIASSITILKFAMDREIARKQLSNT